MNPTRLTSWATYLEVELGLELAEEAWTTSSANWNTEIPLTLKNESLKAAPFAATCSMHVACWVLAWQIGFHLSYKLVISMHILCWDVILAKRQG